MSSAIYTANLQKGGAVLEGAATLVTNWLPRAAPDVNIQAAVESNQFGVASEVRRRDLVSRVLGPRLVEPGPQVMAALRVLLDDDPQAFRDACYFETCRTETMLADFVEGPVFDWYQQGRTSLDVDDAKAWVRQTVLDGRAPDWSDAVQTRTARALLSALRDFGILSGVRSGTRKEFARPYPTVAGFAYVCWRLDEMGVTSARLESSPVWRRWLLTPADVQRLLADLAGAGVILLDWAGSLLRIEWQVHSLTEVAHAAAS